MGKADHNIELTHCKKCKKSFGNTKYRLICLWVEPNTKPKYICPECYYKLVTKRKLDQIHKASMAEFGSEPESYISLP